MRLLLDTHIWVWIALEPERLAPHLAKALSDQTNEFWLSPISVWEVVLLVGKGRINLQMDAWEWVAETQHRFPLREAPLTTEVVLAMRDIHLPHRDPADAFLVATTKVFELTLVTADRRLRAVKGISIL